MKRTLLFLCLVFLVLNLNAQNSGSSSKSKLSVDKVAKQAATEMCDCVNEFMSELHPIIRAYVVDISIMGQENATRQFMKYVKEATPVVQEQVKKDAQRMQNFDEEMKGAGCDAFDDKYQEYNGNKEFESKVLYYLNTAKCIFSYTFLNIGTKDE